MSLGWTEVADLYIGQRISALQTGKARAVVRPHAPDTSLTQVLQALGPNLPRGTRIRVSLSGLICPALAFAPPTGIRTWKERLAVARTSAAAALSADADMLLVESDPMRPTLWAAIAQPWKEELLAWAGVQGTRIISVRPLWAVATQCPAARVTDVRGIQVLEQDAATVVVTQEDGQIRAQTVLGSVHDTVPAEFAERFPEFRDLDGRELLTIRFAPDIGAESVKPKADRQLPKIWNSFWQIV